MFRFFYHGLMWFYTFRLVKVNICHSKCYSIYFRTEKNYSCWKFIYFAMDLKSWFILAKKRGPSDYDTYSMSIWQHKKKKAGHDKRNQMRCNGFPSFSPFNFSTLSKVWRKICCYHFYIQHQIIHICGTRVCIIYI